jgi:hypothetical protein
VLGIIPTATLLDMLTPDDDDTFDALYVRDVLDHKRRSEHYAALLEEIRRNGMALPIMIRTYRGQPWLVDGHHRVAAALDLGITHLIWSDLPVELEDRPYNPMLRGDWGPYRPAAIPSTTATERRATRPTTRTSPSSAAQAPVTTNRPPLDVARDRES